MFTTDSHIGLEAGYPDWFLFLLSVPPIKFQFITA
jgi:hypothetical protein